MKTAHNILELLIQTLTSYLANVSTENLTEISENIMKNYLNNKLKIQKKILYKIPITYSKNELKNLKKYFLKWKINLKKTVLNNSNNNTNTTYYNSSNSNLIIPTLDLNLNYKQNIFNMTNINSTTQKTTLTNNLNSTSYIGNTLKETTINVNNNSLNNITNLFLKRQEIYQKEHNESQKQIIKNYEEENNILHPFIPNVNEGLRNLYKKFENKKPAHLRLYNDSVERQYRQIKLENEFYNNNNSNIAFNEEKFEKLYEDYKTRKYNNKKLKKKIDSERGYTFMPDIIHKKNKKLNRSCCEISTKNKKFDKIKSKSVNNSFENDINNIYNNNNSKTSHKNTQKYIKIII